MLQESASQPRMCVCAWTANDIRKHKGESPLFTGRFQGVIHEAVEALIESGFFTGWQTSEQVAAALPDVCQHALRRSLLLAENRGLLEHVFMARRGRFGGRKKFFRRRKDV